MVVLRCGVYNMSLIIDVTKLTKYTRWLPVIVCIITLIPIKKFFAMHHSIQFLHIKKFIRPNINALKKNGYHVICSRHLGLRVLNMS
jgi:hypothetical protein